MQLSSLPNLRLEPTPLSRRGSGASRYAAAQARSGKPPHNGARDNIERASARSGAPTPPHNRSMKPTPLASLAASAPPRPLRRVEASGFSAPWGCGLSRAPLGIESNLMKELINQALQSSSESSEVDFKESFDASNNKDWVEIVKDIVAMANSGGGVIIFGLNNQGQPIATGTTADEIIKIDPADITNKIHKYTGYHFGNFKVLTAEKDGRELGLFVVGEVEIPMVFIKPGTYPIAGGKQKTAFAQGTIYFRHGAKSEPGTRDDLQKVIERIREKWLSGIQMVMQAPEGSQYMVLPPEVRQSVEPGALPIRFTDDPSAPVYRILDPNITHPYKLKELIKGVNDRIASSLGRQINTYDIVAIKKVYGLVDRKDFIYIPRSGSSQYSRAFWEWLVREYKQNPQFFDNARVSYRKLRKQRNA